jgi:Na+/H+-dicarboxylate symporter
LGHGVGTYADVPTDGTVPNAPHKTPLESVLDIIRSLFPPNLFKAAVDMNVLGIITFSVGSSSSSSHSLSLSMRACVGSES